MQIVDLSIGISSMHNSDLSAVASIERRSYDFPWSENIFKDCLLSGYICLVAKRNDLLVGYTILSFALDEAHILNFCIDKDHRNLGFGDKM